MNPETRKSLGLPPMPVNDNHRREAHMDQMTHVPVTGLLGLYAIGFVCGMGAVMAYNWIF
jgi:hypothetical protein